MSTCSTSLFLLGGFVPAIPAVTLGVAAFLGSMCGKTVVSYLVSHTGRTLGAQPMTRWDVWRAVCVLFGNKQGLVYVPIKHHPTIGDIVDIVSNRYLKVMFKIPEKRHLPSPDKD